MTKEENLLTHNTGSIPAATLTDWLSGQSESSRGWPDRLKKLKKKEQINRHKTTQQSSFSFSKLLFWKCIWSSLKRRISPVSASNHCVSWTNIITPDMFSCGGGDLSPLPHPADLTCLTSAPACQSPALPVQGPDAPLPPPTVYQARCQLSPLNI